MSSSRDDARRSLTTWENLNEWTLRKAAAKARDWREQQGWNHLFGGTTQPQVKWAPPEEDL